MPLPSIHRFLNEDYSGSPSWFQRFIGTLNLFSDPLYSLLNRGLSFQSNFNAQVYSFSVTAAATTTTAFTSTISGKPTGLLIVAVNKASDVTAAVSGVGTPSWYSNGSKISITSIPGLTVGTLYNITVLVF